MRVSRQVNAVELYQVGAICCAALEGVNGNETVATGAVFYGDRLAPTFGQLVGHQAGHTFGAAAHRKGRDDAHRLGRKGLGLGSKGQSDGKDGQGLFEQGRSPVLKLGPLDW